MWKTPAIMVAAVFALGACASNAPPSQVSDACRIFDEKPRWERAMRQTAEKWGAPISAQLAIMRQESSFRHDARPPKKYFLWIIPAGRVSSAYGYSQALDGTWDWYRRDTGRWGADRDDFDDASDFIGWYMHKTYHINGVSMRDSYSQYLAYHEGHGGFRRGNYKKKPWLRQVAARVRNNANRYSAQMRRCGGDL